MYDLLKRELDNEHVFDGRLPQIITDLAHSIDNHRIPFRMKMAIAVSEFILFFSQFQKKIHLPDDTKVPINGITFIISPSGTGKDSSKTRARSCFASAYMAINNQRKQNAKKRAIDIAREEGLENPESFETYRQFYQPPQSLFSATSSTIEGLTLDFNNLEAEGLGSGYVATGEIADEMSRGIADLMQFISELYDLGQKEVKSLRGKENQLKPIENFPVNAMFMGSPVVLLYENHVKDSFKKAFSSKLARRSFFMYAPIEGSRPEFTTIEQFDEWVENNQRLAKEAKEKVSLAMVSITENLLRNRVDTIKPSSDVNKLYQRYKAFNEEAAERIESHFPMSRLVRQHLQWKALKFAGALALFNGHSEITKDDFISAVSYCEMLEDDMKEFEIELAKQSHEIFSDMIRSTATISGKAHMSFHTIKKLGYIPSTGNTTQHIKSLIQLAASYDQDGIYTLCDDGICYEQQQKTDIIGVSYLDVDNTRLNQLISSNAPQADIDLEKHRIASTTVYGYAHMDTSFENLGNMLLEDFAYTPFSLKTPQTGADFDHTKHPHAHGGVRGRENTVGGCKWIVLDVDNSTISAEECHLLLSDINHHIALTSDPDNNYKFRVLIELDSVVDIPDLHWKPFIKSIAEYLAVNPDLHPKSQIFFSYAGRKLLSITDAEPLATKDFIIRAAEIANTKERTIKPSTAQTKAMLNDPLGTFFYAYEAKDGEGSRAMIRAALHAKDLGATHEECINLMYDINDYWLYEMPSERFERTIISYVNRIY